MVNKLKKQAKCLQRSGGGRRAALLGRVARDVGYIYWHHMPLCAKEAGIKRGLETLRAEIAIIQVAAVTSASKLIATGAEAGIVSLLLIAHNRDAWFLDLSEQLVACVVLRRQVQEPSLRETSRQTSSDIIAIAGAGEVR